MKHIKQIMTVLIVVALMLTSIAMLPISASESVKVGDTNNDGRVSVHDALVLIQYLAGWDSAEEVINVDACDCTFDGNVNLTDVTRLLQVVAGWDTIWGKTE